ncbi:hypothetical protein HY949_03805 [Candidatus Gottesmanbacteria bacterium]|nr:hypothetical protein [Candidatus Gottesmanbacteria bacterium]
MHPTYVRTAMTYVTLTVIMWKIITLVALGAGTIIAPINHAFTLFRDSHYPDFGFTLPYWMTAWGNFDAFYYLGIAKRGYFVSELPFFPLYPFFIALLTQLIKPLPYLASGLIIAHVAFFAGLVVSAKLLAVDGKRVLLPLFLVALVLFPTSYSYGAAYNDSVFFLFATLTIYWSRTDRWWLAGLFGALATLTRFNGLALFPYLIIELATSSTKATLATWKFNALFQSLTTHILNGRRDPRIHSILLIPAAFAGYLFYIQNVFGSWTKLFAAMNTWGQDRIILPIQVFWRYGKIMLFTPLTQLVWWVALMELISVLFYSALLVWSFRKIRMSYWIFFAFSILIPSLTGTFQGMPRYGLHLYPLFLVLAMVLHKRSLIGKFIYVLVMLALLLFCVILFTRGYFIA